MQLGSSIGLFIALAIVLLVLFCLISKIQQQGQAYSQVDQINDVQDLQGQYDQFLEKRKIDKQTPKKKKTQEDYLMQLTQVQSPLTGNTDQIYGVSMLRRRLDGETLPMKQQTGRSSATMRSFRPERLNTNRSNENTTQRNQLLNKPQEKLVIHQFINKLVLYTDQGLNIMDICVSGLRKQNSRIIQKKTIKTTMIRNGQQGFQDQLQVLGFQVGKFSCCKSISKVEIPNMAEKQDYLVSNLKISQSKEQIDFSEYYVLKDKVESGGVN